MGKDAILNEIDRRIRRLQAEIEIAEEGLKRLEELGARAKGPKVRDYSPYYLAGMLLWFVIGFVALAIISKRAPSGVKIPTGLYALIIIAFGVPLAYYVLTKGQEEEPGKDLAERGRMARLALKTFYEPLREAVADGDKRAIEAIAEELLENPALAGAIERLGEGDPKLIAYSLLLYARFDEGLESEVSETLERVHNKPVRAMLESLLEEGKGYNNGMALIGGEVHEV
ncbi:hypothetical protein [Thermococcus eurythermalis]|uniref:hypothetical protein n=1 Tax=Thermococcus eurythermalis TaxID=1505907 RepID=UPI000679780D|nr:hypothetical protein [Thermococcus eurythermalis]